MPIQTFPPELLYQCLSHLPTSSLPAASLVSRSWLPPSREFYWERQRVYLYIPFAEMLVSVLNPGTAIPRKVKTLCVDDEPKPKHPDPERQLTWHANLATVMRHFLRTSNLFIQCLDLCCYSGSLRKELLKAARPQKSLSVWHLRVTHIRDALDIMLDQPSISTLALGLVELVDQHHGHKCITPMGQDANDMADHERAAIAISPPFPETVVRLGNLRHLCLSIQSLPPSYGGVWSDVVSALAQARLPKLETLVADVFDHDRGPLLKLIKSTASSLCSLAVTFQHNGK